MNLTTVQMNVDVPEPLAEIARKVGKAYNYDLRRLLGDAFITWLAIDREEKEQVIEGLRKDVAASREPAKR